MIIYRFNKLELCTTNFDNIQLILLHTKRKFVRKLNYLKTSKSTYKD